MEINVSISEIVNIQNYYIIFIERIKKNLIKFKK